MVRTTSECGTDWQVVGVRFAGRVLRPVSPALTAWDATGICPVVLLPSEDTGMPSGTIARLLIDKGFGFIRDESGIEHFFHRSSVRGAVFELLREGQRVDFTPEDSAKGPRAGEVRLIES
jgi:CspA family cold shock protein